MKNLINRVQLIGHLGKDVETHEFSAGKKIAKATMATTESYYNKDGDRVENTDWHNLVAWGKTAELMANLGTKGAKIAISGKISNRSYEDKSGIKKYVTEVIVDEFMLMTPKNKVPF
ncbi:MAG: single-stranded DNA-binding protein [Saprospiraceae bacterium]|nr:single-stranded DNA-binding protein [Saprospiraceae bacterium]